MPKIPFGLSNENIDVSEYRDGFAASVRECYRVQLGPNEHFARRLGLTQLGDNNSGNATQGRYETFGGVVIEVIGGVVYEMSPGGSLTAYTGNTLSVDTLCIFTEDSSNVYVAHGGVPAKIDTTAKTVTLLSGNAPDNVTHITFSNGYLLCNGNVSGGVAGDTNFSDDSANNYSASDSWEVFNNERLADGCNAVVSGWDAEIYSFGPNSVEVSYNDGSTPWAVLQGAYMEYGCLAPYSVAIADNTLFWLTIADGARRLVRMENRAPRIISGPYDALINSFSIASDAIAWTQQARGYSFYVISFPAENKTFAYKMDDGTWSEWGYYNTNTASYERYRGQQALYVESWNKTILGDRSNGKIYYQSGFTDNGDAIRMEITSGQNEFGTLKEKKEMMLYFRHKRGYAEGGTVQYRVRDNNKQWKNEKALSLGSLGSTDLFQKKTSGGIFRSRQYQIVQSDLVTPDYVFTGLENDLTGTGR